MKNMRVREEELEEVMLVRAMQTGDWLGISGK